jgi:hypothetical protein
MSSDAQHTSQQQIDLALRPLLAHLASIEVTEYEHWQDWRIRRIGGGWNNLLYRATSPSGDLAVKFTIRNQRDRAGREYLALTALQQAGLSIAPRPILLDRDHYSQPVVVMTWLPGTPLSRPPTADAEWKTTNTIYSWPISCCNKSDNLGFGVPLENQKSAAPSNVEQCSHFRPIGPRML